MFGRFQWRNKAGRARRGHWTADVGSNNWFILRAPLRIDAERRSQALSPTISDGVILCPTGLGAVAAVDLLSRSLKWGATYGNNRSQQSFQRGGRSVFGDGPEFSPLERRWQEPGMIAQDGVVIISPPESKDFQCRDILTGQMRLGPQLRNSLRYLAGIQDGRLIAVGERQVSAIELNSGKPVWQTEYPSELTLVGKGLWQTGSLMLPLSERNIVRIDLRDGAIAERMQVSQPLGNLFAYKQQLLSVSAFCRNGLLHARVAGHPSSPAVSSQS